MPNAICNSDWIGSHTEERISIKLKTLCLKFCQGPTRPGLIGKFFYQNLLAMSRIKFNPDRDSEVIHVEVECCVVNRSPGIHVTGTVKGKCLSKFAGSKGRRTNQRQVAIVAR